MASVDVMGAMRGLVLDSLFADIEVEVEAAQEAGCAIARWDGDPRALREADFVLHVRTPVDIGLMSDLEKCRAIGRFGTGLDTVDLDEAARRGIAVVGVHDYATNEVAQHSVALALAVARRVPAFESIAVGDAWPLLPTIGPTTIDGPVGIVGFGAIGRRAAGLFRAIGIDVIVASRQERAVLEHGFRHASVDDLLADSQVVSLHVSLSVSTHHLLDGRSIALMRRDAIVVNTARGALIDSPALGQALADQQLNGVGLDVFETGTERWWQERRASGLNVVLTPHVAWYSPASARLLRRAAVERTIKAARDRGSA